MSKSCPTAGVLRSMSSCCEPLTFLAPALVSTSPTCNPLKPVTKEIGSNSTFNSIPKVIDSNSHSTSLSNASAHHHHHHHPHKFLHQPPAYEPLALTPTTNTPSLPPTRVAKQTTKITRRSLTSPPLLRPLLSFLILAQREIEIERERERKRERKSSSSSDHQPRCDKLPSPNLRSRLFRESRPLPSSTSRKKLATIDPPRLTPSLPCPPLPCSPSLVADCQSGSFKPSSKGTKKWKSPIRPHHKDLDGPRESAGNESFNPWSARDRLRDRNGVALVLFLLNHSSNATATALPTTPAPLPSRALPWPPPPTRPPSTGQLADRMFVFVGAAAFPTLSCGVHGDPGPGQSRPRESMRATCAFGRSVESSLLRLRPRLTNRPPGSCRNASEALTLAALHSRPPPPLNQPRLLRLPVTAALLMTQKTEVRVVLAPSCCLARVYIILTFFLMINNNLFPALANTARFIKRASSWISFY